MARVNMSLRLSSGTLQAFPSAFSMLSLQYLDVPARRLYLLSGCPGEGMRPHRYGTPDLPVPEDLDRDLLLPDEPGPPELLDTNLIPRDTFELPEVDGLISGRAGRRVRSTRHTLQAGQPALQGHLAALVSHM